MTHWVTQIISQEVSCSSCAAATVMDTPPSDIWDNLGVHTKGYWYTPCLFAHPGAFQNLSEELVHKPEREKKSKQNNKGLISDLSTLFTDTEVEASSDDLSLSIVHWEIIGHDQVKPRGTIDNCSVYAGIRRGCLTTKLSMKKDPSGKWLLGASREFSNQSLVRFGCRFIWPYQRLYQPFPLHNRWNGLIDYPILFVPCA